MKITETTMLDYELRSYTKADLKEIGAHFGLALKGDKWAMMDELRPYIKAHNDKAKEIRKRNLELEEQAELDRRKAALDDFEKNATTIGAIADGLDALIANENKHIVEFSESILKYGVDHSIRHYSSSAIIAERKVKAAASLKRYIVRDDITLADKLIGIEAQRKTAVDNLVNRSEPDPQDQATAKLIALLQKAIDRGYNLREFYLWF